MSDNDETSTQDWTVICVDCLNTQSTDYVMNSTWYQQGMTPPCQGCGGVTREVPVKEVAQFIDNARKGKSDAIL